MTATRCHCWDNAIKVCASCGRALCEWHSIQQPAWSESLKRVVLGWACFPLCDDAFWRVPYKTIEVRPGPVQK